MRKIIVTGVVTAIVGVLIGLSLTPLVSSDNIYQLRQKFDHVFNMTYKNYVDEVDAEKLTEAAIQGMLEDLDPHSVYINAEKMKGVEEDFSGKFEGIGIQFDIINDTITVVSPIAGGPSEELGIQAGDKIVKIDGEDAVKMERDEVPKKLKGPKGTVVVVDIKRNDAPELLNFKIIRDEIPIYTVDASYIVPGTDIGVIAINRFAATTHKEMMEAADNLKAEGMKRMVLDLRGNPGGYLTQAFYMADEFLGEGEMIVYTKSRRPEMDEEFPATAGGALEDIPLIVMVNAGSASASEIVSGAVQDLDRGLVVGTTSFGKGLVQRQYPLPDGSAFRLTISRYYTPSGRCIQRPYDDKNDYRRLVGRLELEEGMNIEHALEKIKDDNEGEDKIELDSIPMYETKNGRKVIGGGGITPDYVVKSDTITHLSIKLRQNRVFYEYVSNSLNNGKNIPKEYQNDFTKFYNEYRVTDAMLADLRKLAESKDIEWDDKHFETDKEFMKVEIKANIARGLWDRGKYIQVFSTVDKQMQTALKLFPEAVKIANLN